MNTTSNDKAAGGKCVASDIQLMSRPPQNRCKNCGQTWVSGGLTPVCVSPSPKTGKLTNGLSFTPRTIQPGSPIPPTDSGEDVVEGIVVKLLKGEISSLLNTIFSLDYSDAEHSKMIHKNIDLFVAELRTTLTHFRDKIREENPGYTNKAIENALAYGKQEGRAEVLAALDKSLEKIPVGADKYYYLMGVIESLKKDKGI